MPLGKPRVDEEALIHEFPDLDRRAHGAFFTPAPLVQAVLDAVRPSLPEGPLTVVDPAAGAGAFLAAAKERLPGARLFGLELHEDAARWCRARVTGARVVCGDGLREGWEALLAALPEDGFEAWIGNPPYNGTSPVLRDPEAYSRLRALFSGELPPGQSLRDDFAFFLLRAARRLEARDGVLAFVTPSTLIDGFLYAPIRHALLERLSLSQVLEVGGGAFRGARVRTCVTVWRSKGRGSSARPRYRARAVSGPFEPGQLGAPVAFDPEPPERILRPAPAEAVRLHQAWSRDGEPLTTLVPVSLPGLKTRFDELLVDDEPGRLLERVRAFAAASPGELERFAAAFGIPERCFGKLAALRASLPPEFEVSPERIRPFYRYAGARHRGTIPESARAWCYLDRRLIPRGDHRFRGDWDPHAGAVKLVFNVRELPLSAALLEREGCVHDHRHARFAPLFVPAPSHPERSGAAAESKGPATHFDSVRSAHYAQCERVTPSHPERSGAAAESKGPATHFDSVRSAHYAQCERDSSHPERSGEAAESKGAQNSIRLRLRAARYAQPERDSAHYAQPERDSAQRGDLLPNLSPRGLRWAEALGGPHELFRALVLFINSEEVQACWAPCYGAVRVLPVNLEALLRAKAQT